MWGHRWQAMGVFRNRQAHCLLRLLWGRLPWVWLADRLVVRRLDGHPIGPLAGHPERLGSFGWGLGFCFAQRVAEHRPQGA